LLKSLLGFQVLKSPNSFYPARAEDHTPIISRKHFSRGDVAGIKHGSKQTVDFLISKKALLLEVSQERKERMASKKPNYKIMDTS